MLLTLFPAAASAPSPLYADYARRWHFSDGTLTAVFAIYALPLLLSLLLFGTLSDQVGRKPVALVACALLAISLVAFVLADGLALLATARAVQGLATGLLTAVASAALLDLQPGRRPGLASLLGAALSTGGLGVGALLSGLLVQYAWMPNELVFLVLLIAVGLLGPALVLFAEETVTDRHRPRLRLRVAVPRAARYQFLAAVPCLVATWALIGFYLSLGPKLVSALTGSSSHLPGAASVAALTGLAAVASVATRRWKAPRSMITGCALLALGSSAAAGALFSRSTTTFALSVVLAGLGFGLAFSGAFRGLVALAEPDERGGLVAATYVVGYLTFALFSIAAGLLSTKLGLLLAAIDYSIVVAGLALLGLVATLVVQRRPATSDLATPNPPHRSTP